MNSCTELSQAQEIVNIILDRERDEYKLLRKKHADSLLSLKIEEDKDSHWESKRDSYLVMENSIRSSKETIPRWEVAGPLDYSMTLGTMRCVIAEKFKEMRSSGQMMSEASYLEERKKTAFHDTRGNNLTRIWGANFLKSILANNPSLKAADHFLIFKEGAKELIVEVWHSRSCGFPIVSVVKNAYVVSKKIEGYRNADFYKSSPALDELKYRDFSDLGNIITDKDSVGWIVDTEEKSFDPPKQEGEKQQYLQMRFKLLAGNEYDTLCQTFKIALSEI